MRRIFYTGRKIISCLLITMGLAFALIIAEVSEGCAEQSKLAQAVYITASKACSCTLERCQAGDWLVDRVFVGEKKALIKRVDYAVDKDSAREYISKYHLTMPPSLLFWDKEGNLLWRADGELDLYLVAEKVKEFGA